MNNNKNPPAAIKVVEVRRKIEYEVTAASIVDNNQTQKSKIVLTRRQADNIRLQSLLTTNYNIPTDCIVSCSMYENSTARSAAIAALRSFLKEKLSKKHFAFLSETEDDRNNNQQQQQQSLLSLPSPSDCDSIFVLSPEAGRILSSVLQSLFPDGLSEPRWVDVFKSLALGAIGDQTASELIQDLPILITATEIISEENLKDEVRQQMLQEQIVQDLPVIMQGLPVTSNCYSDESMNNLAGSDKSNCNKLNKSTSTALSNGLSSSTLQSCESQNLLRESIFISPIATKSNLIQTFPLYAAETTEATTTLLLGPSNSSSTGCIQSDSSAAGNQTGNQTDSTACKRRFCLLPLYDIPFAVASSTESFGTCENFGTSENLIVVFASPFGVRNWFAVQKQKTTTTSSSTTKEIKRIAICIGPTTAMAVAQHNKNNSSNGKNGKNGKHDSQHDNGKHVSQHGRRYSCGSSDSSAVAFHLVLYPRKPSLVNLALVVYWAWNGMGEHPLIK